MGLMMKNVNIMGVHSKIRIFFLGSGSAWKKFFFGGGGGGGRVESPKKVAWIVCRFQRGFGKGRGYVFEVERGWDLNAHYELEEPSYWHKYLKQITL